MLKFKKPDKGQTNWTLFNLARHTANKPNCVWQTRYVSSFSCHHFWASLGSSVHLCTCGNYCPTVTVHAANWGGHLTLFDHAIKIKWRMKLTHIEPLKKSLFKSQMVLILLNILKFIVYASYITCSLVLQNMYRQLLVLLGLFKSYKPECVPEDVPAISVHSTFKKINQNLLTRFRRNQVIWIITCKRKKKGLFIDNFIKYFFFVLGKQEHYA